MKKGIIAAQEAVKKYLADCEKPVPMSLIASIADQAAIGSGGSEAGLFHYPAQYEKVLPDDWIMRREKKDKNPIVGLPLCYAMKI